MNYDEMSDFDINKEVAEIVTDGDVISFGDMALGTSDNCVQVIYKVGVHGEYFDYCNNPSDAWPIISDNGICIQFRKGKTSLIGMYNDCKYECESGLELRTAIICFLKMKDEETK